MQGEGRKRGHKTLPHPSPSDDPPPPVTTVVTTTTAAERPALGGGGGRYGSGDLLLAVVAGEVSCIDYTRPQQRQGDNGFDRLKRRHPEKHGDHPQRPLYEEDEARP